MATIISGDTGITTPAETVQGALTTTGNTILGDASTDTLNVGNGGLVKDASGNVGIGVTPSAWGATYKALQIGYGATISGRTASPQIYLASNAYVDSGAGNFTYISTNFASQYYQYLGAHVWQTAASGTAGNAITFTEAMTLDASSNLKFNSGYGSAATAYGCRAWVNFNGTGTVAIRASGNVSSITDTGTGQYTVNFTTAMVDVNYTMIGTASWTVATNQCYVDEESYSMSTHLVGSIAIGVRQTATTLNDAAGVYVAIFR